MSSSHQAQPIFQSSAFTANGQGIAGAGVYGVISQYPSISSYAFISQAKLKYAK